MVSRPVKEKPSRGHKKRERTRGQLIAAGLRVLAEKGDGLTISDVVAEAEVSNGTFYNYFADRDELIDALAEHSLVAIAAQAAIHTTDEDPALRFTVATLRVLKRAGDDPIWGRAILRLTDHRRSSPHELHRYLREDLAAGFDQGRFEVGPDDVTLDAITGLIMMSIRRIVRGESAPDHVERVLQRALCQLGVAKSEAATLAAHALAAGRRP
jgi:AcrR family transcriptional regulator